MAGPDKWTGTGPRKDGFQECVVEALSANHDTQLPCEGAQAATITALAGRVRILMEVASSSSAGSLGACSQPELDVGPRRAPSCP